MKINTFEFKNAVSTLAKEVGGAKRVQLHEEDGNLAVEVRGRSVYGKMTIPVTDVAKNEKDVIRVVSMKHLAAICGLLVSDEVAITLREEKDSLLVIKDGESEYKLLVAGKENEVFSGITGEKEFEYSFLPEEWEEFRSKMVPVAGTEESRPQFMGVNFVVKDGEGKAYATNTHMLARMNFSTSDTTERMTNVPRELFAVRSKKDVVKLSAYANVIVAETGDSMFAVQKLIGSLPDCERVIPKRGTTILLNRAAFLAEVRKMLVCENLELSIKPAQIYFREGFLEFYTESGGFGSIRGYMNADVPREYIGQKVAYNAGYLKTLERMDGDEILFSAPFVNESISLTPARFEEKEGSYVFVVTPMRVTNWSLDE